MWFVLLPMVFILFIILAIRANKYIMILVPIAAILVLWMKNIDLINHIFHIILQYSWLWILIALVIAFVIGMKLSLIGRVVVFFLALIVGCGGPILWQLRPIHPLSAEDIVSATLYSANGNSTPLDKENLNEFKDMLSELSVKQDVWEEYTNVEEGNDRCYFEAVLDSGKQLKVTYITRSDTPVVMIVEQDGNQEAFIARNNETDLGLEWIQNRIMSLGEGKILSQYKNCLKSLKDSVSMKDAVLTFTVPNDFPDQGEIIIVGRPALLNKTVYWLNKYNENHSWVKGQTYTVDFSNSGYQKFLVFSARINQYSFDLIDLYELLPEDHQAVDKMSYFHDSGI